VRSLQAELLAEGHRVSLSKLCGWLGVPRRSMYYKPKARPEATYLDLTDRVTRAQRA
jgi:putative transposase